MKDKNSTIFPESLVSCVLFEEPNIGLPKDVTDAAQIPYTRVVEAMDLNPWNCEL